MYKNVALSLVLLLVLAACGGSGGSGGSGGGGGSNNGNGGGGSNNGNGGGGSSTPSSITLTVEDPVEGFSDVAAAYQVGTGNWTAINAADWTISGSTRTFTFPLNNQTKYGVAVRCGNEVTVLQATRGELPNPKIVCSSQASSTASFTVNVNISSDIQLGNGDKVCVNENSTNCASVVNNSASITLNLEPGTRDLLITLKDSFNRVKVAKVEKGVNVPTNGGSTTVSLQSGDVEAPVSFAVRNPPQGYNFPPPFLSPFALVAYLSANGTASGLVNDSPTSYRPVKGSGGGDLYTALIMASHSTAGLMSLQFFVQGATLNLDFPTPWRTGSLTVTQTAHPTVSGLTRSDSDLQGYEIVLNKITQSGPGGNPQPQPFYTAFLSKAWLDSADNYTLPDLSSLPGYIPLQSGESAVVRVTAVLSNKTVSVLLSNLSKLLTNPTNPSGFASGFADGDYIRTAVASGNFAVGGGGDLSLP